jgi:methyl-accepting chemotaxis protein
MSKLLMRFSISVRLFIIVLAAVVALIAMISLNALQLRDEMMAEKQLKTRHLVETAYGTLVHYHKLGSTGAMDEKEAKKAALKQISTLRYDKNEYFWINDYSPRMVMHPMKPALDGKDLSDFKDPNGKKLFVAMADIVKKEGAGFVDYLWPKPGHDDPVPKTSYVKGFRPWGWIIGSGIYLDDVEALFKQDMMYSFGIGGVITALLIFISITLSRSITHPLHMTITALRDVASGEGDLTRRLEIMGRDEVSQLSTEFNTFADKLQLMLMQVASATQELSDATTTVANISDEASKGVVQQQSETDQVATAATEMSSAAQNVAESASHAASSAQDANGKAQESRAILDINRDTTTSLQQAVENAGLVIRKVGEQSQNIGGILTTIREIADQTNLLALNAAIEAARAGEQGRGFAVVADEVRTLAQRTQTATGEIEEMISELQEGSKQAALAMDEGQKLTEESVTSTEETSNSLREIISAIALINDMNAQIASAAEEQAAVVEDINRNIVNISTIAGETSDRSQETNAAMREMEQQVDALRQLLGQFRLS